MQDTFPHDAHPDPPRGFAGRLGGRLKGQGSTVITGEATSSVLRIGMVAAALIVAAALFIFPSARASAQAFLDLFRVVNFTAVPVDVNRINELSDKGLDIASLIGEQVEVLADAGPAQMFATPADAAKAAGIELRLPGLMPPGVVVVRTEMEGEHSARITADTRKLMNVLDALGITDIRPPADLDGQVATVRVPPVVRIVYANGAQEITFLQAKSPEVTLPASVNVAALGEIGLRIAGLDRAEAHTLAQAIDWRGTLVVPVPAGVSSFRQVDVHGNRGLFVESTEKRNAKAILWSESGSVYGLTGSLNNHTMLEIADSVQ